MFPIDYIDELKQPILETININIFNNSSIIYSFTGFTLTTNVLFKIEGYSKNNKCYLFNF